VRPHDTFTWFLEVAPVLAGIPLLIANPADADSGNGAILLPRENDTLDDLSARPAGAQTGLLKLRPARFCR
jgi:hypothetical protein